MPSETTKGRVWSLLLGIGAGVAVALAIEKIVHACAPTGGDERHVPSETEVDEALEMTFPASDAPSY